MRILTRIVVTTTAVWAGFPILLMMATSSIKAVAPFAAAATATVPILLTLTRPVILHEKHFHHPNLGMIRMKMTKMSAVERRRQSCGYCLKRTGTMWRKEKVVQQIKSNKEQHDPPYVESSPSSREKRRYYLRQAVWSCVASAATAIVGTTITTSSSRAAASPIMATAINNAAMDSSDSTSIASASSPNTILPNGNKKRVVVIEPTDKNGGDASGGAASNTMATGLSFSTINDAIEGAQAGSTILIPSGVYEEQIDINKPNLTLKAALIIHGDDDHDDPGVVLIEHMTENPYENTIRISAPNVTVTGLTVRHSSPSVASNYAVRVDSTGSKLIACSISSKTGSGIGTEGGDFMVSSCDINFCKRHGVAIFPGLTSERTSVTSIENCRIRNNGLSGVYARGDAQEVSIFRSEISNNAQWGVTASGGAFVSVDKCTSLNRNGKGKIKEDTDAAARVLPGAVSSSSSEAQEFCA